MVDVNVSIIRTGSARLQSHNPAPVDSPCHRRRNMTSVGVRELRQSASELLRRVEQGETFEITDRGLPVALLSPLPAGSPLDMDRPPNDQRDGVQSPGRIRPVS
jgi:prevent-host-death family protein